MPSLIESIRALTGELDEKELIVRIQWLYSPSLICISDEYNLLEVNPAWTAELGWDLDELTSQTFLNLIHPDDIAKTLAVIEEFRSAGTRLVNFTNRYRCKNGDYKELLWYVRVVVGNCNRIYGFARVVHPNDR